MRKRLDLQSTSFQMIERDTGCRHCGRRDGEWCNFTWLVSLDTVNVLKLFSQVIPRVFGKHSVVVRDLKMPTIHPKHLVTVSYLDKLSPWQLVKNADITAAINGTCIKKVVHLKHEQTEDDPSPHWIATECRFAADHDDQHPISSLLQTTNVSNCQNEETQ